MKPTELSVAVSLAPLGTLAALQPSGYLSMHSGHRHSLSGVLLTGGMEETLAVRVHV